jgi:hypothetical protein
MWVTIPISPSAAPSSVNTGSPRPAFEDQGRTPRRNRGDQPEILTKLWKYLKTHGIIVPAGFSGELADETGAEE